MARFCERDIHFIHADEYALSIYALDQAYQDEFVHMYRWVSYRTTMPMPDKAKSMQANAAIVQRWG